MKDIWVRKQDGSQEKFTPLKVRKALRRSGLSAKESETALKLLRPKLHDGISTKKIYAIVYGIIRDLRPEVTHKFNLKRALHQLGPAGYNFEDFIAKLFASLGYKTQVRQIPLGKCITHEVDVIAKKGKEKLMVECKFKNEPGIRCRAQTILYVYSRFIDLRDGAKLHSKRPFTKACLVTNAKFSGDVVSYANCMGMRLIGWRYPFKGSLEALIDRTKCYPITVIPMNKHTRRTFFKRGILTVTDVPDKPGELAAQTGISLSNAKRIVEKAKLAKK